MILLFFFLTYWLGLSFRYYWAIFCIPIILLLIIIYRRTNKKTFIISISLFFAGLSISFIRKPFSLSSKLFISHFPFIVVVLKSLCCRRYGGNFSSFPTRENVIFTNDNPRTENPDSIIEMMLAGVKDCSNYEVVKDRRSAIEVAFSKSVPGDVLLIAGKGHEDYQIIGKTKYHYSDREVAMELTGDRK